MARISPVAGLSNNHKITFGVISTFTFLFAVSFVVLLAFNDRPASTVKSVESFFAEFQMNFQGNDGNFASEVKYYSKGYQFDLMFMSNEVLLNLYSTYSKPPGSPNSIDAKTRLSQVSLEFVNAHKTPVIKGLTEFVGDAGVATRVSATGVSANALQSTAVRAAKTTPSYTEIKYSDIYPGIDVYFSGKQKQLFYEFVLSETADTSDIVLKVNGLDGLGDFDVDMHGNINVTCRGKQMQIRKPEVFRVVNQARVPVSGYFIVTPKNEIKFRTAEGTRLL